MSQTSPKEKFDDEQLLSIALAIELNDVKKTLAQLKIEKPKPTHSAPFSLNVDYYSEKILKKQDSIGCGLEKLESGEQSHDLNLYKIIWKVETFSVIFNNANLFEESKNKNDTDPNLARVFCSTAYLSKPYGYSFFTRALPYGCGPAFGTSMSITISLIAGPFDDILTWPFDGTIQIRQNNSGLIWKNLSKTNDKTTPCFSRPSPSQTNPSCGIFFCFPHEEMFKTDKNLKKNDNGYIQMKILDFP